MRAWSSVEVPNLPVVGPTVRVHDTASGALVETSPEGAARLYVCGITPYDATHLGHAATYVAFDLLNRAWRSAGHDVTYVQNVTDVDDPLLERAAATDVDWVGLAEEQTQLFREDMEALRVLSPDHYVGAVESIPLVVDLIRRLQDAGAVYEVDHDLYFAVNSDAGFGAVSGWARDHMVRVFPERGGDPDRAGKRDPLDCVLWLAERPGEPAWDSPFGRGRPGWHVECTAIALHHLGMAFEVQGGGSDLVFPHHEMCASEAQVAHAGERFAQAYAHAGMVAYDGEKMSKSRGNLVFVSALRNDGVDPMAVRFALLRHHYRSDWEWTEAELSDAEAALEDWRAALTLCAGAPSAPVVDAVLRALAEDLDAPSALHAVQAWVDATRGSHGPADSSDVNAGETIHRLLDATLGLSL